MDIRALGETPEVAVEAEHVDGQALGTGPLVRRYDAPRAALSGAARDFLVVAR